MVIKYTMYTSIHQVCRIQQNYCANYFIYTCLIIYFVNRNINRIINRNLLHTFLLCIHDPVIPSNPSVCVQTENSLVVSSRFWYCYNQNWLLEIIFLSLIHKFEATGSVRCQRTNFL